MNSVNPESHAWLSSFLFEVSQIIHICEFETKLLEDSILSWVELGDYDQFPIENMQRFDYLRQMQADIFTVTLHLSSAAEVLPKKGNSPFDVTSLFAEIKLSEVKERMLRASSSYQVSSPEGIFERHISSDVQFFLKSD